MDSIILYKGSDMLLDLETLMDDASGAVLNAAAVSITLKDAAGVNVAGETWPKTMAYVTGSNGVYRAVLPNTLAVTANARYTAEITAINTGQRAFWTLDVLCKTRRR